MKLRALAVTAAALTVGTALAILGPASPAVGFFSPPLLLDVHIQPTATLVAKGAAVETRIDVTCAGAAYAYFNVSVVQRVGSEVATGYSSSDQLVCTGQRDTHIVLVMAQSGKAFKKGPAVIEANIFGCAYSGCGSEDDQATVDITQ